jgi:anhydro-N-acetylmuramic acid kinase
MRAIGLMSGTSLDGIDAACVELHPRGAGYALELVRATTRPFTADVRARLLAAVAPHAPAPSEIVRLDRELGELFVSVARDAAAGDTIDFVASHGLTLFHRGEARETMQIGAPYALRDALTASVVFDFRRADCAAGGQGAPLVPHVDALLFASHDTDVVALNLGGIANVTVLERGAATADATAWDTGPGNMLIDAFVRRKTGGVETFDRDGEHAERGRVDRHVLRELIAREAFFLMQPPPKSTGRERFGEQLLDAQADLIGPLSLGNGCATLAAFTAATIAESLSLYGPAHARVVASGGGTRNRALMAALESRLRDIGATLVRSSELGVDADAKEAVAFAILGYETLRERPANVLGATGAGRRVVLGAIVPYRLESLLAKMRAECAANGLE